MSDKELERLLRQAFDRQRRLLPDDHHLLTPATRGVSVAPSRSSSPRHGLGSLGRAAAVSAIVVAVGALLFASLPLGPPGVPSPSPSAPAVGRSSLSPTPTSAAPSPVPSTTTPSLIAPSATPPPEPVAFGVILETATVKEVFGAPTDATPFASVPQGDGISYLGETLRVGDVDWHLVQFIFTEVGRREWISGWIAGSIGTGGDLVPIKRRGPRCQPGADVTSLGGKWPTDYLSCEGDLTLDGYIVEAVLAAPPIYSVRPAWLGMDAAYLLTIGGRGADTGALELQFPPGVPLSVPFGTRVRVTGHFDDPRAADCRRTPQRPRFPVESPGLQALWCRQRFVVTSIDEL